MAGRYASAVVEDRITANEGAGSNSNAAIDDRGRRNMAVIANLSIVLDQGFRIDDHVVADFCAAIYDRTMHDNSALTEFGSRRHVRQRRDNGSQLAIRCLDFFIERDAAIRIFYLADSNQKRHATRRQRTDIFISSNDLMSEHPLANTRPNVDNSGNLPTAVSLDDIDARPTVSATAEQDQFVGHDRR